MYDLLSVDPGFRYLGMAYWVDGEFVASNFLEMRERGDKETFIDYRNEGLHFYYSYFDVVLNAVERVVFETMPLNNVTTQRVLASMVISLIITLCKAKSVTIHEISAREVKKSFADDAKATKAVMRRKVLEKYPQVRKNRKLGDIPFDEMDAIAIGDVWLRKQ